MNDWNTNESALLPGARSAPVGTPSGIVESPKSKFWTNRAGNSMPAMFADRRARTRCARSPKVTKWLLPRHELAAGVDAALQVVEAAGTVEVVPHVVFARPQQLHRRPADLLGDARGLGHVVVGQPAAEPAAGLHHVHA